MSLVQFFKANLAILPEPNGKLQVVVRTVVFLIFANFQACQVRQTVVEPPVVVGAQPANAEKRDIVLQAVGDINLAGSASRLLPFVGYDYAFWGTRSLLQQGDVNIANLESPIGTGGASADKRFTFLMPPSVYPFLKGEGFNVFHLANNHILDFGPAMLQETIDVLRRGGSHFAGAGENLAAARRPAVFSVKGVRFGYLAYSLTFPEEFYATADRPGTAFGHEAHVRQDVAALRPQVDLVIVAFHWGAEGMKTPKPYQRQLGQAAIEAGADVVLGHHPHVVQPVEFFRGKPIFYSLGNYAFGSYSNRVEWGALARLRYSVSSQDPSPRLTSIEVLPLDVNNFRVDFCPMPANAAAAERAFLEFSQGSQALGSRWRYLADRKTFLWNGP